MKHYQLYSNIFKVLFSEIYSENCLLFDEKI